MNITINENTYTGLAVMHGGDMLTLHMQGAAQTIESAAPLNSAPTIEITDGGVSRYAGRRVLEIHRLADASARIVMQADPIEETEAQKLRAQIAALEQRLAAAQAAQSAQLASHDEQIDLIVSGETEEVQENA